MNTKHDRMMERIRQHGGKLLAIFPRAQERDPIRLCKKLRRIEGEVHRQAEQYCNGVIGDIQWQIYVGAALGVLNRLLGHEGVNVPIIINGDPRGYALKIDDEYVREHNLDIMRDWGGYGIIAPDLREE